MRAYATEGFGQPGSVRDLPVPEPEPGEIRIQVAAAGMNPVDNAVLQGYMKDMAEHRFPLVPGVDASGTIDAVGEDVEGWKVGDSVFGSVGKAYFGGGTYAEYVTMSQGSVANKPPSLEHERAAALPVAGATALNLVDALQAEEGQPVLAIGASGGVGSYFVQLATQRGARVIAVTRSVNTDYVRSLGAEDVIDYTTEDVGEALAARYEQGIDAIADMIGNKDELQSAAARVRAGGRVASCVGGVDDDLLAQHALKGENIRGVVTKENLELLASQLVGSKLRAPKIETFPLDQAADALARLAARQTRGKLVLEP